MPHWRCDWRIRPSSMTTPATVIALFWWQTRVWWCGGARRFRNGSDCEAGWMRARVGTILDSARLWCFRCRDMVQAGSVSVRITVDTYG